ncbi:MAG: AtpZ/AtpI family protein [Anaerolineae bacterium]
MRDPMTGSRLILQLTAIVALAGAAPLLAGILLDRLLQTSPCLTLFMTGLGITLGTVAVIRQVNAVYSSIAGGKK